MSEPPLTLGVLGGMGPAATLKYLARLQALTPARTESDHIRVIADINPRLGELDIAGSAAAPVLAEMAGALGGAGAQVLAMPCNTAHAHADQIQRASGLPLIDMIALAADAAAGAGARRCGVLGTRGAIRLYREYLAARAMGLVALPPERQEAFLATLERIRSGEVGQAEREAMIGYLRELAKAGAEVLIAGCTEVLLVLSQEDVRLELVDPGELLAQRSVAVCLGYEPAPRLSA